MYNKIYPEIKKLIRSNYQFFIGLAIGFLLISIKLPFYINAPGGVSDISSKIHIENFNIEKEAFNLAYVYEFRATIPTIIFSYFNKDWDLVKRNEIELDNETIKEADFRDNLMLKEANQNAILYSYNRANKEVKVLDEKLYVTYIFDQDTTNLKIGDEIIKVNNNDINNEKKLKEIVSNSKNGDIIEFEIIRKGKKLNCTATLFLIEKEVRLGIMVLNDKKLKTSPNISLNFKSQESGPSGGLMMSLAIYDTLTNDNLTKSKKIAGTGTIDIDGNVGAVGGVSYKVKGAWKDSVDVFFVPNGENYKEAIETNEKYGYNLNIVGVSSFDEAYDYLKK